MLGKCSDNFGEDEIRLKTNSFLQNLANNMQLPFEISASIGYASNMETGKSNLEGLLCVADKRMYKDKSGYKELKVRA